MTLFGKQLSLSSGLQVSSNSKVVSHIFELFNSERKVRYRLTYVKLSLRKKKHGFFVLQELLSFTSFLTPKETSPFDYTKHLVYRLNSFALQPATTTSKFEYSSLLGDLNALLLELEHTKHRDFHLCKKFANQNLKHLIFTDIVNTI